MAQSNTEIERAILEAARGTRVYMYAESKQPHSKNSEQPLRITQRCANCDIDILWPPTIVQGKTYCCTGCAAGGPCNCDYSQYRSVNISGVIHYGPCHPE